VPAQLFFGGTFLSSRRAFESPMAIACFRLFTVLPLRPLFSLPCFISRISVSTLLPAESEYFRIDFFFDVLFFAVDLRIDEDFFAEDFFVEDFFLEADFLRDEDFFLLEVSLVAMQFSLVGVRWQPNSTRLFRDGAYRCRSASVAST
jgi:hypothetical protein